MVILYWYGYWLSGANFSDDPNPRFVEDFQNACFQSPYVVSCSVFENHFVGFVVKKISFLVFD